ncbi:hypothetical protein [Streptomyces sp. NPDC001155]
MSSASAGRDWAAMQRAEFDRDAPIELPVPTGRPRIPATPDAFGTEALFGDQVPAPQQRARPPQPGDSGGQDGLF